MLDNPQGLRCRFYGIVRDRGFDGGELVSGGHTVTFVPQNAQ
jgi:hypothetical protein